jgi:hypothetical protein
MVSIPSLDSQCLLVQDSTRGQSLRWGKRSCAASPLSFMIGQGEANRAQKKSGMHMKVPVVCLCWPDVVKREGGLPIRRATRGDCEIGLGLG